MAKTKNEKIEMNIILILTIASLFGSAYVMKKVAPLLKQLEEQKQA